MLNRGAITEPKITVVNVGRFTGSGVGNVPKHPTGFCGGRVPKRPTAAAKSLSSAASGSIFRALSPEIPNLSGLPQWRFKYVVQGVSPPNALVLRSQWVRFLALVITQTFARNGPSHFQPAKQATE